MPVLDKEVNILYFLPVHGDLWWQDGEFWARKGVGRVRVAPSHNLSLDIFLTSLAANDYNSYYRQIQASEFGAAIRASDADFVIAGGNLEVDPRSSETSYRDVARSARVPVIRGDNIPILNSYYLFKAVFVNIKK